MSHRERLVLPERCNFSSYPKRECLTFGGHFTLNNYRNLFITSHVLFLLPYTYSLLFLRRTLLNILLLTSDLFAAFFDILTVGFRLTPYFCIAFLCIVIGIVLYEAGPSPAAAEDRILGVGGTPVTIEFRDRGKRNRNKSSTTMPPPPTSSLMCTEHAGNLSPSGILDRELT